MTTIDHKAEAEEASREAMRRKGERSRRWHRKAQVHATLALAEQTRPEAAARAGSRRRTRDATTHVRQSHSDSAPRCVRRGLIRDAATT